MANRRRKAFVSGRRRGLLLGLVVGGAALYFLTKNRTATLPQVLDPDSGTLPGDVVDAEFEEVKTTPNPKKTKMEQGQVGAVVQVRRKPFHFTRTTQSYS